MRPLETLMISQSRAAIMLRILMLLIAGPVLASLTVSTLSEGWWRLQDADYWASFQSSDPVHRQVCEGAPIDVATSYVIERRTQVDFLRTLLCRSETGAERPLPTIAVSRRYNRGWAGFAAPPAGFEGDPKLSDGLWRWPAAAGIPVAGSLCRLRTEARMDPSPGVRKEQVYISTPVSIVACD